MKLFCFPFAGGSKYSYALFQRYLPPGMELVALDLPGRGGRFSEALLTDMDAMVSDMLEQLRPQLDGPFAFYGHSMGTIIAYQLLDRLEQESFSLPAHLFLSGRGGPSTETTDREWHKLPSAEFRKKLLELGGSPKEVLEEESLMVIIEPILRADFQAVEQFSYPAVKPRNIPVTVMIGTDEITTEEEARTWQEITLEPIELKCFKGGHFFIFDEAEVIMQTVQRRLSGSPAKA